MSNFSNCSFDELAELLSGPFEKNIHLHREILLRVTPDFEEFFNSMEDGPNKKQLAKFVLSNVGHFESWANLDQVREIASAGLNPTNPNSVNDGTFSSDGKISLIEDFP